MRILIHDYAGHNFAVHLSRELAKRGHRVLHLYAGYNQTPRGALEKRPDDPQEFNVEGVFIRQPLNKYSFFVRWRQEREYGERLRLRVGEYSPDVVLSCNTPLDAQAALLRYCKKQNVKFIYWVQDLIGIATKRILGSRLLYLGSLIGSHYIGMERRLLAASDKIILITEDFHPVMSEWRISKAKISVIPNWASLNEIQTRPKSNSWAEEQNVADKTIFLYTGTLGLKHNPDLLLQLALHFRNNPKICVLVVSEGLGADWLAEKRDEIGLANLTIVEYQPMEQYPDVLASGDILVAILEPEAGVFAVPSKVLSYLCASRPLLLAVPPENLSARIVSQNRAGIVVHPTDIRGFVEAADSLYKDRSLRTYFANNALAYARKNFDIKMIVRDFEKVLA